jgi:hypothetical protein
VAGVCTASATTSCGENGVACNNCGTSSLACTSGGSCVGVVPTVYDPNWSTGATFSADDLSISTKATATVEIRALDGRSKGKWYWEVTATGGDGATDSGGIGIAGSDFPNTAGYLGSALSSMGFGYGSCCYVWYTDWTGVSLPSGNTPTTAAIKSGNIYMFALDMDSGILWAGNNGVWYNSGNPATGGSPAATGLSGTVYPAVTFYGSSINAFTANFGSSGFVYPVPAGFYPGFGAEKYGYPTLGCPTSSAFSPGYLLGEKVTVPVSVTLTGIGFQAAAAGVNVVIAVYDASGAGGAPGKLVAATASTPVGIGPNQIPVPATPLPAGGYWIEADYNANATICHDSTTTNPIDYITLAWGAAPPTPPATFPAPPTMTSYNSFYASYWVIAE